MPAKPCRACRIIQGWSQQRDQWGHYSICTGHEAPGKCFWCGAEVKNRRFCAFIGPVESYLDPWTHKWEGDEDNGRPRSWCHRQYWRHFFWPSAAAWCWERAEGKCQECGTFTPEASRRTHHIQPLNGSPRAWNILNRPENLLALCAHHHGLKHSADISAALKKVNAQARAAALIRASWKRQPAVFLCPVHGAVEVQLTGIPPKDAPTWARGELEHQPCRPKPDPLEEGHLQAWRAWALA
mgnify:FL=1